MNSLFLMQCCMTLDSHAKIKFDDNRICTDICQYEPLLTYLLTPWSRVLLEKLAGFAASQEFSVLNFKNS